MADVIVNLGPLKRFERIIDKGFDGQSGPVKAAFLAWGPLYRSAMRKRFLELSKGGGGGVWPPLKRATIRNRRGGKLGRRIGRRAGSARVSILIDTGMLISTLDPVFHGNGQIQESVLNGLRVGIGGGGSTNGGITLGQLAAIHHFGTATIPARTILVDPNLATSNRMAAALEHGIRKAKAEAGA